MLDYQIVAGFSEIKTQLRTQAKLKKAMADLKLWFGFEEDVLYAHDFHDHEQCIALAVYNRSKSLWRVIFQGNAYGREVIEYAIGGVGSEKSATNLNNLYKSHGFV